MSKWLIGILVLCLLVTSVGPSYAKGRNSNHLPEGGGGGVGVLTLVNVTIPHSWQHNLMPAWQVQRVLASWLNRGYTVVEGPVRIGRDWYIKLAPPAK